MCPTVYPDSLFTFCCFSAFVERISAVHTVLFFYSTGQQDIFPFSALYCPWRSAFWFSHSGSSKLNARKAASFNVRTRNSASSQPPSCPLRCGAWPSLSETMPTQSKSTYPSRAFNSDGSEKTLLQHRTFWVCAAPKIRPWLGYPNPRAVTIKVRSWKVVRSNVVDFHNSTWLTALSCY